MIPAGLSIFAYNGINVSVAGSGWPVRSVWKINPNRTGWLGFSPGLAWPGVVSLNRDQFYLIDAIEAFNLPDAQQVACVGSTLPLSGTIPNGLSMFLYAGPTINISTVSGSLRSIWRINDNRTGWVGYIPSLDYPSITTLETGMFYLVHASSSFELEGAQVLACPEMFGSETFPIDLSMFAKSVGYSLDVQYYPDALGRIVIPGGGGGGMQGLQVDVGTFIGNQAVSVFEKGTTANIEVRATVDMGADTAITDRKISKPGHTWDFTTGLSFTAADSVSTATTYTAEATGDLSGRKTDTATITPVGPSYHGVVNTLTPTESDIKGLTKQIWAKRERLIGFNAVNQRAAFAEPASFGIRSLFDQNGFPVDSNFTRTEVTYTLADNTTELYNLYVKKVPAGNGSTFNYRFV